MSTTIETIMNSKGAMIALAIIAFLMAAVLVLVIVRMLFGGRLRMPGGRARQARLGIVDAFDLDRQRQLIIVRRDNTEHLIMIGGPNDLVIESEIVRVEARDMRRDKTADFPALANDGRIPAPFAAPGERQDQPELVQPPLEPAQAFAVPAEPMLPLPSPPVPHADAGVSPPMPPVEAGAQRTPTFPLPPRRPPPPERRPMPSPRPEPSRQDPSRQDPSRQDPSRMEPTRTEGGVEAIDTATRPLVEVPAEPSINAPVAVNLPPPGPGPAGPTPPPAPLVAPAPATPRTMPPSFLKPLPPRPPLRPLVRTNPRPPGVQEQTAAPAPPPVAPPAPPPAETTPVEPKPAEIVSPILEAPPLQPAAPSVAPSPEKDALESLEEEMAKLLGRGPG